MRNIVLALSLFLISCNDNTHNDLLIKKQITDITNEYNKICQTLKVERIAEFHSDKNFIYYWHGGLACSNNADFRKLFTTILSATTEWSMKTSEPVVQVVGEDAAIISFTFEAESVEINGTRSKESGALTYIWNKTNDKWKIVHVHESAK